MNWSRPARPSSDRGPTRSPSLLHYPDADAEVQTLATDLWGDTDGVTDTQHAFGKGMTYWGLSLDEVLQRLKNPAGFCCERLTRCTRPCGFIAAPPMRISTTSPISRTRRSSIDARFRVSGKDVASMAADERKDRRPPATARRTDSRSYRLRSGRARICVRRFSPCRSRSFAHRTRCIGDRTHNVGGSLGRALPAEPGRTAERAHGEAHLVDRQLRSRRQILLRHSDLYKDDCRRPLHGFVRSAHLSRSRQGARYRRGTGERHFRRAHVGAALSSRRHR